MSTRPLDVTVLNPAGIGIPGAIVTLERVDPIYHATGQTDPKGNFVPQDYPLSVNAVNVHIDAPGYLHYDRVLYTDGVNVNVIGNWPVQPVPGDWRQYPGLTPAWPAIPTRLDVLGTQMSFMGGLVVPSQQYGLMPWWPSALSWLSLRSDRQNVYDAMRAAGDTHALIEVPNGLPLYDEQGQFYNPQTFGPLDWTNGETRMAPQFSDLVSEVIQQGFKFVVAMDERQPNSTRIVQLVAETLTVQQAQYGYIIPGYDGVFYGWPNDHITIPRWAALARAINQNLYLGIEFNVGHIPLGSGTTDYAPGGLMSGYDAILGEFLTDGVLNQLITPPNTYYGNQIWQVVARCVSPYHKPADQPPNADKPNPPFYLVDSPRGPRTFTYFETSNPYDWVRINPNDGNAVARLRAKIGSDRQYARNMGCAYLG